MVPVADLGGPSCPTSRGLRAEGAGSPLHFPNRDTGGLGPRSTSGETVGPAPGLQEWPERGRLPRWRAAVLVQGETSLGRWLCCVLAVPPGADADRFLPPP